MIKEQWKQNIWLWHFTRSRCYGKHNPPCHGDDSVNLEDMFERDVTQQQGIELFLSLITHLLTVTNHYTPQIVQVGDRLHLYHGARCCGATHPWGIWFDGISNRPSDQQTQWRPHWSAEFKKNLNKTVSKHLSYIRSFYQFCDIHFLVWQQIKHRVYLYWLESKHLIFSKNHYLNSSSLIPKRSVRAAD